MGSEAFDRDQYRLAWVTVVTGFVWIVYYGILLPGSVNVPGTDTPFAAADGNTLVLIHRHTDYTTMLGFAYGVRPVTMWALTLLPLALTAWWCYRAHRDDWDFLHA